MAHQVRLISPQFVTAFVSSNKNDFANTQAICEAASCSSMRFVRPRTDVQQTLSTLDRVREGLVRDCTGSSNLVHVFLLEFGGISLPKGPAVIKRLLAVCRLCCTGTATVQYVRKTDFAGISNPGN